MNDLYIINYHYPNYKLIAYLIVLLLNNDLYLTLMNNPMVLSYIYFDSQQLYKMDQKHYKFNLFMFLV